MKIKQLMLLRIITDVDCGNQINPLNAELSPIFHLLALLEAHPILHISRIRVKQWYVYKCTHTPTLCGENMAFVNVTAGMYIMSISIWMENKQHK